MLTEPIRVRPGEGGRLIVQLPYSSNHVAKIKTVAGCGQGGGFGQARHLPYVSPFLCATSAHLLEGGYDIRTVQELLRHEYVKTTIIYTHVLHRGPAGVPSMLDGM